ncbi:Pup--protein ligase [Schaalia sp. Marseille-Q2122]|uniref:Pup--protein ligase n=1 Tax=Schaalia sp. Marseille-Q2122 TaxID=2736604 RepID=UPI00158B95CF|nr:Pup--protein ligase [Schaalia sp. Marseille-Q2122]
MRRRVVGIETEYGLTAASTTGGPPPIDAEAAARYLFSPLLNAGRTSNLFTRNGGRLYLDVGSHPEYATAECDRLEDLLAQVRAGGQMLADLAVEAEPLMREDGVEATLHLIANNLDSQGNSYGCHENYLLHRRRDFREVADALVAFFITRQILVGSGHIRTDSPTPAYCFSQRADQMWDAVSSATTRSRPIINTRDEPLADSGAYRRMHVIVGDTNIAEPTTALKVGATELLLTAVEDGLRIQDLALADPMRAIREINTDLSGRVTVELADGRMMTAVQIQDQIRQRVIARLEGVELGQMHRYVLDLWNRGLRAVESGEWSGIDTELDVAIKKKLLDSYCARTGAPLNDPRVARLMLMYHEITAGGMAEKMEKSGMMKRLTTPEQVRAAMAIPPTTTRAHLRGRAIGAAQDARADLAADWMHLRLDDASVIPIALQDPLSNDDPRVDALIERIYAQTPILPA